MPPPSNAKPGAWPAERGQRPQRRSAAYTLVELLLVLALMVILAGVLVPLMDPGPIDSLSAAASILVADLEFARSLAIENGSQYRVTLVPASNQWYVHHVGASAALNTLPQTAFRKLSDPADRQTTALDELPLGNGVTLLGAKLAGGTTAVGNVEFTALGGTVQAAATELWLAAGVGSTRRYVSVTVLSATGLTDIGAVTSAAPAGL